jgi:MoxR-vWA-beta-propeller ternary system domain bpX4
MIAKATDYFVQTLYTLRNREEVILYAYDRLIPVAERTLAADFLETEYENECLGYPGMAPAFDAAAALWGAQTVYSSAQLLLYRQDKEADLASVLLPYTGPMTPSAILSADLCLRFLPDVLQMAKQMDSDDLLVTLLTTLLQQWHYSAIGYRFDITGADFDAIISDACLRQLYVDRVITRQDQQAAILPPLMPFVKAAMGNYQSYFWKEL